MLTEVAHLLLHGPASLLLAYGAVEVPMLIGLMQGRASLGKLAASPLVAVPLTVLSAVALGYAEARLNSFGFAAQLTVGLAICAGVGYGAARWATHRAPMSPAMLQRGAIVLDEAAEPVRAARRGISLGHDHTSPGLRLAGLPVAAEDETKHFKLIGTTGTGKSTAIAGLR